MPKQTWTLPDKLGVIFARIAANFDELYAAEDAGETPPATATTIGSSKLNKAPADPLSPTVFGSNSTPAELGTIATNDGRLSDARTPTAHKATHEPGGTDALTALTHDSIAAANKDGLVAVPSMRTLGTGAQQSLPGTHAGSRDGHPVSTTTLNGFQSAAGKALEHTRAHSYESATDHSDLKGTLTDGQIYVKRTAGAQGSGLYPENPASAGVSPASETVVGITEQATQAEVEAGTAGNLFPTAARLFAEFNRRLTPEAWHVVGAAGEPAFENGWVNFGAPDEVASFYKDPFGTVWLRGTIKSGTVAAGASGNVLVLPAGYRPTGALSFIGARIDTATADAKLTVLASGPVRVVRSATVAEVSLNGIFFRAA